MTILQNCNATHISSTQNPQQYDCACPLITNKHFCVVKAAIPGAFEVDKNAFKQQLLDDGLPYKVRSVMLLMGL